MLDNIKAVNRLSFLIGALAVFILLFCLCYYVAYNWFRINRVTITGNIAHITKDKLTYITENKLKGTFFTLNIDAVQREFQQIPWVKNVHVTREFPDSITVTVTEYNAIANLGDGKLLSEDRQIFAGQDEKGNLPLLITSYSNITDALNLYSLIQPFMTEHHITLKSMAYNGVGLTKLGFSSGLNVTVCGSDIVKNLQVLNKYWRQLYQMESQLAMINMCYQDALAIK